MRPYVLAGFLARILTAPFLLQWFHPDERQMLEFAHYHAHGRLHPFMEATDVHLRNQTLPSLFSWLIRLLDSIGLPNPWAYLALIHAVIGLVSWAAMVAMVEDFRADRLDGAVEGDARSRIADRLGWFLALFWAFPFLYSRQLLEAVSLPPAIWLWVKLRKRKFGEAGFLAGMTSILRYPSALWPVGAFALASWGSARSRSAYLRPLALAVLGFALAVLIGGIADMRTYGGFLESAGKYWDFNRPGGPVASMFGSDSLIVYWRWFEYLFTPWLAPLFAALAIWGLARSPHVLLFCAPYVIGHLWTPHREPRFMLPLMPFLALAVAHAFATAEGDRIARAWRSLQPGTKRVFAGLAALHLALNFAWYPMNAWAQYSSAQGALTRSFEKLRADSRPFFAFADPPIDALIPAGTRWADPSCRWRRAPTIHSRRPDSGFFLVKETAPEGCKDVTPGSSLPPLSTGLWTRLLRVRAGRLWDCVDDSITRLCPDGIAPNAPNEPLAEPL